MERAKKIAWKIPSVTVLITFLSAVFFVTSGAFDTFVYDRKAVLNGEAWRILTASLTHFSLSHLFWNLFVFLVFGVLIERISRKVFLTIFVMTSILSGLTYLLFFPSLSYYCGLSGVISGVVAYLCLSGIFSGRGNRHLWTLILIMLFLKISVEVPSDQPVFASGFRVLPSSHLIGIAVAFFCWLWVSTGARLKTGKSVLFTGRA